MVLTILRKQGDRFQLLSAIEDHAMRLFTSLTRCSFAAIITLFFVMGYAQVTSAQPGEVPAENPDTPTASPSLEDPTASPSPEDPSASPSPDDPTASPEDPAAPVGEAPISGPIAESAGPEIPVNLRLRRLEQRVQALKERAWRAKARVGMLKEAVLGGGVGARANIQHVNKMGNSYRLIKLVYALDGAQIFARNDASGALHKEADFDVLTGPISPGSHTISVLALYRGHGYGVFKYLKKYKFTVRSSHTFTASEGKGTSIKVVAFERGGVTTPLDKRPAFDFKVNVIDGGKGK